MLNNIEGQKNRSV